MKLRSLGVKNFRNIENLFLKFEGKTFFFLGANGEGKTNILEALYCAFRGKSFRTFSHKADWLKKNESIAFVQAQIENSYGYVTDIQLKMNSSGRWESRIDEKKISPKSLRERIPVVVFSPEDHGIIRSGPENRRAYIDDLFSDVCPGYLELSEKFDKALSQRNELLKRIQNSQKLNAAEWNAWEEVYVNNSVNFWQLRAELLPSFMRRLKNMNNFLFSRWENKIDAAFLFDREQMEKFPTEKEFKLLLEKSRDSDLATGWTHHGPHRDDLKILIGTLESRAHASQGQARMLAFALKSLQAQWIFDEQKESPIFLVDDFSSEFDAVNRSQLMHLVNSLGSQAFLTGTEASLVDSEAKIEYTQYTVQKGSLTDK